MVTRREGESLLGQLVLSPGTWEELVSICHVGCVGVHNSMPVTSSFPTFVLCFFVLSNLGRRGTRQFAFPFLVKGNAGMGRPRNVCTVLFGMWYLAL